MTERDARHGKAERVFFAALDRPVGKRSRYVAEQCGDDPELADSVLSLLAAHDLTGPLDELQEGFAAWCDELSDGERGLRDSGSATDPSVPEAVASDETLLMQPRNQVDWRLGRYEIQGRLGAGGMGEVFRAHDPLLGRSVAIKVIRRRIREEPEMLTRFAREARTASALNHPHIVTVHDLGEHDGHPFIVMEMVKGQSLRRCLAEPLPVDRIVALGAQIADGLAAAHEAGIVHRDLKPANILIDERDSVRILDFGIAAFHRGGPDTVDSAAARRVAGTAGYMAPEMLQGDGADHRSDQFALGVVLYEMATGRSPFQRSTSPETLMATLHDEPQSVAELREDLPGALVEVIHRCLAKSPDERYPDLGEIVDILRSIRTAPPRRRGLVPTPATPLIGREKETRFLRELILEKGERLVVLAGAGGSGKTRLAIEVARALEAEFAGGVVYVPLAAIRDPELVVPTIAHAVGAVEHAAGNELPGLVASLAATDGPLLLVLDNFEQVIDAAPSIGEMVAACSELTVLVTSREILQLSAEHAIKVLPLQLPPAEDTMSVAELADVPSVAMFAQRVQAGNPDFELDARSAPAVAELCRRLDGLPLALELAAARMRAMTPESLLSRLESRLAMLTGGARDLPDRQRSLQATMDWSYELLDDRSQTVFRRLAVFAGGFSLEAAEGVVDPFGRMGPGVLAALETLLGQSLLTRHLTTDGEPRFTMLETIREYAEEKMEAEENLPALRKAHAAYFMVLAEDGKTFQSSDRTLDWIERFDRERANFRAALRWMVAEDEGEWGLKMAAALFPFWERGYGREEGLRLTEEVLALPSAQKVTELRAHAFLCAVTLGAITGRSENERAWHLDRNLAALDLYRQLGHLGGEAASLNSLASFHLHDENWVEARKCYEEAIRLWEQIGQAEGAARAVSNLALVDRKSGELDSARELYQEASRRFEALGDGASAALAVSHEAGVARDQEDPAAEDLYRRALDALRALKDDWGTATALLDFGELKAERGDYAESADLYREACGLFHGVGHPRGVAAGLERLALLATRQRDDEEAMRLAGVASRLRDEVGLGRAALYGKRKSMAELDAALVAVRERLGPETSEDLWSRGRRTPLDRAIAHLQGRAQGDVRAR